MSNIFSIGISGLTAFQRALGTIGHNIVNANTEGYSRQEVNFQSNSPQFSSGSFFGTGVNISGTKRIFDQFYQDTYRQNISTYNQFEALSGKASEINLLVADPSTGMAGALDNFFSTVDGVSNNSGSITARQVMLTQGEIIVDRFNSLDAQLSKIAKTIDEEFEQLAIEINAIASNIATINSNIVQSQGLSDSLPSDMLDQRDNLIDKLSELINVTTIEQSNGSVNLIVGGGNTLVVDNYVNKMVVVASDTDSAEKELRVVIGGSQRQLDSANIGGKVAGLLKFREETLNPARSSLGHLAIGFAETFNFQHRLGIDLNNNLGANFFNTLTTIDAISNSNNNGNVTISGTITDVNQLEISDYRITYDGNYNVTRLKDNVNIGSFSGSTISMPGEGITLTVTGTATIGDTYLLRPTRTAAKDIATQLKDARLIAAASPIRTQTSLSNTGSGAIEQGTVTSVTGAEFTASAGSLSPPLLIQFDTATTYRIFNNSNPASPVDITPSPGILTFTPNQVNQVIPSDLNYGFAVNISGAPNAGDSFEVVYNTAAVSDNRNALALSELQNKSNLNKGTTTYRQAYGVMVADVGNKSREFEISKDASLSLLRQSEARKDSVSGVNLDEEAAKLIQFQNAYQAAAQVIVAASKMIEELINATR